MEFGCLAQTIDPAKMPVQRRSRVPGSLPPRLPKSRAQRRPSWRGSLVFVRRHRPERSVAHWSGQGLSPEYGNSARRSMTSLRWSWIPAQPTTSRRSVARQIWRRSTRATDSPTCSTWLVRSTEATPNVRRELCASTACRRSAGSGTSREWPGIPGHRWTPTTRVT